MILTTIDFLKMDVTFISSVLILIVGYLKEFSSTSEIADSYFKWMKKSLMRLGYSHEGF
jgi:hypothetical protein